MLDRSHGSALKPPRIAAAIAGGVVLTVAIAASVLAMPLAAAAYGPGDRILVGGQAEQVAFSPDGTTAWVTNLASESVSVIDVATSSEVSEISLNGRPAGVTVSPDGSEAWVALNDSPSATDLAIVSTSDLSTTYINSGGNGAWFVEFNSSGSFAYVTNYFTSSIAKIDTSTRAVVDSLTIPFGYPVDLELSANGSTLYVALSNLKRVVRVSPSTMDLVGSPIGLYGNPTYLALSPGGDELWVREGLLSIISTTTHEKVGEAYAYGDGDLAFDSDGMLWSSGNSALYMNRVDPTTREIVSEHYLSDASVGIAAHPTQRLVYALDGDSVVPYDFSVSRVAGTDRYSTSVSISTTAYPLGADTVYIATGLSYPDALAAGPVASKADAPILLTRPDALPPSVAEELERLDPAEIVVVGGPASVSTEVETQLANYGSVTRIAGGNRYDTARQLVESVDFGNHYEVFVATGRNFPDALSGGAVAANQGAPLILVNGTSGGLDATTLDLIAQTTPTRVNIFGNTSSVSSGIATSLTNAGYEVVRVGGSNRYETSVLANQLSNAGDQVILATGTNFPDAIAGTPLAAAIGAYLYVVPQNCVPRSTLRDIERVGARHVTLLGGTPTLSTAVENLVPCA